MTPAEKRARRHARYVRTRDGLPPAPRGRPAPTVVPYALDPVAVALVERHPDGCTLEMVGEHLGLTRERVRQVQEIALAKIEAALTVDGLDAHDFARWLARPRVESDPDTTAPRSEAWVTSAERRDQPLPVAAWSEHGQRVEAACAGLDGIAEAARARRDVARVVEGMEL